MEEYFQVDKEGYIVEDFENVTRYGGVAEEGYVEYVDYERLLAAYKDLKERHQKLLDIAGGHYL